jgi:hypothetical protein
VCLKDTKIQQMLQHQSTLYSYHGLLFDVYDEYLSREQTCSDEAITETNIDGETPQFAALQFVDIFGILLVTITGFLIAFLYLLSEFVKQYLYKRQSSKQQSVATSSTKRIIVRRTDFYI